MKGLITTILTLCLFSHAAACTERPITLTGKNTVILSGEIESVNVDNVMNAMIGKAVRSNPNEPIYLLIVSGGGNYSDALHLKQFLVLMPNVRVICKYCASAAGMIFATFPKPNRYAVDKTNFMMHEMYLEHVTAEMVRQPNDLISMVQKSDDFDKMLYSLIGITKKNYEDKIRNKEWVVGGAEAVKLNLADEIVQIQCDSYLTMLAPKTCANRD